MTADYFDPDAFVALADHLGVETRVTTDTFGRVDVTIDRQGMRAFRDAALALGFADIAATISKALKAGGKV